MEWVRVQIEYGSEDLRHLAEDRNANAVSHRWGSDVVAAYRKRLQILDGAVDMRDLYALRSVDVEEIDTGSREQRCYSIRLNEGYRLTFAMRLNGGELAVVVRELVATSVKGGVR